MSCVGCAGSWGGHAGAAAWRCGSLTVHQIGSSMRCSYQEPDMRHEMDRAAVRELRARTVRAASGY